MIKITNTIKALYRNLNIFAGLRHLIADFTSYGHELNEAANSAKFVFGLTLISSVILLMEIW